MCGICGEFNFRGNSVDPGVIKRMSDSLAYRGPDDEGLYCEESIGLRRLSIIDLSSKGHQPMWSSNGLFCIVFNGEVYNFQEIRKELLDAGSVL